MRKMFVFALLALLTSSIQAQSLPIRYGVVGGLNVSTLSSELFTSRVGFHLGGKAEVELSNNLFFEPAAMLSLKGGKVSFLGLAAATTNLYYLDIPLHVGYRYDLTDDVTLLAAAGPYFGVGLFGKTKGEGTSESSRSAFGDEGAKRFDFGVGLRGGVEFKSQYQLYVGYGWGLLNMYGETGLSAKNRNLSITLAYLL